MNLQTRHIFEFGPFRVDASNRLLLRDGEVVPVPPKAFDILLALVENSGQVLEKEVLMRRVWPDSFVEEANLSNQIFTLRKALGEKNGDRYVKTIPRRGYRFVATVTEINNEDIDIVLSERTRSRVVIEEESETSDEQSQPAELSAVHPKATLQDEAAALRSPWQSRRYVAASVAAAIALVAGLTYYVTDSFNAQRSDRNPAIAMKAIPLTSFQDQEFEPALSPDGRLLAFAWTGGGVGENINIYVMQTGGDSKPLRLTTTVGRECTPAWSPDGRLIAFVRFTSDAAKSGLFVIPALGGPERKLLSKAFNGLSWSPDGKSILFVDRNTPSDPLTVFLLSVDTLETRRLTSPRAGCFGDHSPVFSPDGKNLIFTRYVERIAIGDLYILPVAGGEPTRLTFDNRGLSGADWTPDGSSIVFSSDRGGGQSLWEIPSSGGAPERLAVDTENGYGPTISRLGKRLAYTHLFSDSNIYKISVKGSKSDHVGSSLIASSRRDKNPRLSRDGTRIVFESNRSGTSEIWVADSDGSNQMQVTFFGGSTTNSPCWSPDGRQIALVSRPESNPAIFIISVEGGPPRRLTAGSSNCIAPSWSKDGQWIYFGSDQSGSWQVWKMPAAGGEAVQITNNGGYEPVESPDGQFLYYNKYGFGTPGLFRIAVEGGQEAMILDLPQLESFGDWAVTDEGIYFIHRYDPPGKLTKRPSIRFLSFATNEVAEIVTLEKDPAAHPGLNISPDGQWMIYSRVDYVNHDIMLVDNFQ